MRIHPLPGPRDQLGLPDTPLGRRLRRRRRAALDIAASPGPLEPAEEDLALRSIRDALLPEEIGDFDREFRHVMREATETLDLTGVLDFLRRWRRVAWSSRDPQAHRRMLAQADDLNAGTAVPTESWSATKARLGL